MSTVDPKALREELGVQDPADLGSQGFLRYVMRLSEAFDLDFPVGDYPQLATLASSVEYLRLHRR